MAAVVYAFLGALGALFRSRISLQVEIVALRHQLAVYQRRVRRPHLCPADRILWAWLSRHVTTWREALVFVQPATAIAWQRKRFRDHWARMSRAGKPGRPPVSEEIRELIRKVSGANPLWGMVREGFSGMTAVHAGRQSGTVRRPTADCRARHYQWKLA